MLRIVTVIVMIILSIFLLLIFLLNLTPGFFQESCCGKIVYISKIAGGSCIDFCPPPSSKFSLFYKGILLNLSLLDLNK